MSCFYHLPADLYPQIIKPLSPSDKISFFAVTHQTQEWSKNNNNWFLIFTDCIRSLGVFDKNIDHRNKYYHNKFACTFVPGKDEGFFNRNIDYRNKYYHQQFASDFIPEEYDKNSNYEHRYLSMLRFAFTNTIKSVDHVKWMVLNTETSDSETGMDSLCVSVIENIISQNDLNLYIKICPFLLTIYEKLFVEYASVTASFGYKAHQISEYLMSKLPIEEFYKKYQYGSLKLFSPFCKRIIHNGNFVHKNSDILKDTPAIKRGFGTSETSAYILYLYCKLHGLTSIDTIINDDLIILAMENKPIPEHLLIAGQSIEDFLFSLDKFHEAQSLHVDILNNDILTSCYSEQYYLEKFVRDYDGPIYR
jgi:hypothetical protein